MTNSWIAFPVLAFGIQPALPLFLPPGVPHEGERQTIAKSTVTYAMPAATGGCGPVIHGPFSSVQVNVDALGCNIVGDAANEPTIAVDPTDPNRMVIGWRQFDTVASNFREAGYAYSRDGGLTWTFPGAVVEGLFSSDPVLAVDSSGTFYYLGISTSAMRLAKSTDAGTTWTQSTIFSGLNDKPWMAIDTTGGIGDGHIYLSWRDGSLKRSTNAGLSFSGGTGGKTECGTVTVDPYGNVFIANSGSGAPYTVCRSTVAQNPSSPVIIGRCSGPGAGCGIGWPNGTGLIGQTWVVADHSSGPNRGRVYLLTPQAYLSFSTNSGTGWSPLAPLDDDPAGTEWFASISVAPNGRVDVTWNDTVLGLTQVRYSYSLDGGLNWTKSIAVTPNFDSRLGLPHGDAKIGDYYQMLSDAEGALLAYSATFNGEQDVYLLRIRPDCNANGIDDSTDIANGDSVDCTYNGIPDECEWDCNGNGIPDSCDIVQGTSADCTGNWIPDECEADCNGNKTADTCDVYERTSFDCNGNKQPDECESVSLGGTDCNGNCLIDRDHDFTVREPPTVFAEGFEDPAGIVVAEPPFPPGLLVRDFGAGAIYAVAPEGTKTVINDSFGEFNVWGGCFAPQSFTGGSNGFFILTEQGTIDLIQMQPDGTLSTWATIDGGPGLRCMYNPPNEGPAGNAVLISGQFGEDNSTSLVGVSPDGSVVDLVYPFAKYQTFYGLAAAPVNFGALERPYFIGSLFDFRIYAISRDFVVSKIFASTSVGNARNVAVSPRGWAAFFDFGPGEKRALVAALGRSGGGAVHAYDEQGRLLAILDKGPEGNPIEPSGLAFLGNDLLIGDSATGRVLRATPGAFRMLDCNGNNQIDFCETADGFRPDCNGNGIPDACDMESGISEDCNINELLDDCEVRIGQAEDCNLDAILDECWASEDCDVDGIPDWCLIRNGLGDCDSNGRLDVCSGDYDCDLIWNDCDDDIDGDGLPNGPDRCNWTPVRFAAFGDGRPMGDWTGNCAVEIMDLAVFLPSFGGPGKDLVNELRVFDADLDSDADLSDFKQYQITFTAGEFFLPPCPEKGE